MESCRLNCIFCTECMNGGSKSTDVISNPTLIYLVNKMEKMDILTKQTCQLPRISRVTHEFWALVV